MKNLATDPHTPPVASTAAEPMNQAEERKAGSLLPQESPIIPGTAVPQSDSALAHDRTVISLRPVAAPSEFVRSLSLIDLARSLEGRQLHHFSVEQMIGGGGMGAVFRGRDLRLDREVAIKVIPESRRDAETLRRFRLEAQSAARLDHPNIARVYDIGEDESWNYIVFEYIEGINLRDLVQLEGPLSIDDAVYTTRQVAEALQHADDRGVVHRDIKPSNVIITPAGLAKVVDMGLARNTAMEQSSADQTASGVTLGTFDYISPEQARDPRDADVRSDLYSLGCTLFFMLSGQPPFPEGTALQKLLNHGSQPPPDPRQWRDDISDELFAVLAKMMAKRPADRYQKPLELINDLLLIAQKEGLARSRTAGNLLLRPSVARRSLLETNLPWLVSLCGLLAIAIWLQSSDSLTVPLELPKPTFEPRADRGPRGNPVEPSRVDSTSQSWAAPPRGSDEAEDIKQVSSLSSSRSDQPSSATNVAGTPSPGLLPEDQRPPAIGSSPPATANAGAGLSDENSLVRAQQANGPSSGPSSARSSLASRDPLFEKNGLPAAGMPANSTRGVVASAQPESPSSVPLPTTNPPEAIAANAEPPIALGREVATGSLSRLGGTDLPGGVQSGLGDRLVVSQRRPLGLEDSRWSDSLPGALAMAADNPEIRVIELRESIELNQAITWPRSGLTVCAAPDALVEVILSGQWTSGMGWESWFDVQRWNVRFERIHFLCRNDMHQKQAMFLVQPGGELELFQCAATLQSNQDALLGSCIVVQEADRLRERNVIPTSPGLTASNPAIGAAVSPATAASSTSLPTSNDMDSEPVTITIRQSLIRGHQNMVSLRTVCRAEITLEKTCAILEGRGINLRATEQDRMPPVVRLNLDQSTLICRQGFAAIQTAYTMRAPITLTRTARMCAFWSPPTVPHITVDGLTSLEELELLLQLRGEDNAYDQNISTLCQCRLADGQHIDFSFRDAPGEWFRERGNDSLLRWQTAVPPEQPLEQQQADDYRLRGGMFVPGLPPDSLPPPLAPLAKH